MKEKEIINQAKKLFYRFQIIPEATPTEKEYYKQHFNNKGIPEKYPAFYNKVLVKRYQLFFNSWEYAEPINLYTLSQLQALVTIEKEIRKANDACQWDQADALYISEENFLNQITPPEAYQKAI